MAERLRMWLFGKQDTYDNECHPKPRPAACTDFSKPKSNPAVQF
jgi:hypothetical protein